MDMQAGLSALRKASGADTSTEAKGSPPYHAGSGLQRRRSVREGGRLSAGVRRDLRDQRIGVAGVGAGLASFAREIS